MPSSSSCPSLHVPGSSRLHRLHPLTKLTWVLLTGTAAYLAPGGWSIPAALLALNLVLVFMAGVARPCLGVAWRTLLPLAVFMLPIHGLLHPENTTPLFAAHGIVLYVEGMRFAGLVLLRLAAVLVSSLLFVLTTDPADFLAALGVAGLSPAMAWLLGSPLLMLPAMRARIRSIQAAQRARGLDSEGSLLRRIRAVGPMIAPFVLGAFAEIEQRTIALEVRGFSSSSVRTSWRTVADSPLQRGLRRLMVLGCVCLAGARVAQWL